MTALAGRDCLIKKNGTTIGGLITNGAQFAFAGISIKNKGTDGYETTIAGKEASKGLTLTGEGQVDDQVLRDIAADPSGNRLFTDITYVFSNGDQLSGNFRLTQYDETAGDDEAELFNVTWVSDGAWTWTPSV